LARAWYKASAPGSLMLMGEHAVLHGHRAMVAAISQRVEVTVKPREDREVRLHSALGSWHGTLDLLHSAPPFTFIVEALKNLPAAPACGFDLAVTSPMSTRMGLGTSAAVTVATLAAAGQWTTGAPLDPSALLDGAVAAIRSVQGVASGADAAAAIHGGVLLYRAQPREILPVCQELPVTLLYCGYKKPTAEVVRLVQERAGRFPDGFDQLFELMDTAVGEGLLALQGGDLPRLGFLWDFCQGLMDALGVNNADLQHRVEALREKEGILGAKISGSGLGDGVIGLGHTQEALPDTGIDVRLSGEGVRHEAG